MEEGGDSGRRSGSGGGRSGGDILNFKGLLW